MFAESMLEDSWANCSHRGWATLTSFGLQLLAAAIVLLIPILFPAALPQLQRMVTAVTLRPPPGPPPAPPHARSASVPRSNLANGVLVAPPEIPQQVAQIVDEVPPPQVDLGGPGVADSTGRRGGNGWVPYGPGNAQPSFAPPPPPPPTRPPRQSRMMEGNLIHKVQPEYPDLAKRAHIQGMVVLQAVISRDGTIENLRVLSGHPMLVRAAIDAVSKWRYLPYYLNGEAVEVETQVTVNFTLN